MERDQKIVNRILKESKQAADTLLENAKADADGALSFAKIEASNYIKTRVDETEAQCKTEFDNAQRVGMLKKSKEILRAKNQVIENVFARAAEQLSKMKKADYIKFISAILENHAEEKDELILPKKSKLSKADIKLLPVFKARKLKIAGERDDISGGVIISSKFFNKDFTFEALLAEKRENLTLKIAKELF